MINKIIIKDRKGQLGKILTTIPAFLLIVFIMGLFLVGSFFVAKVKGVSGKNLNAAGFSAEGDVLLKKVAITAEKENKTELSEGLLLDAILMYINQKITEEYFNKVLEKLVDKNNLCLIIVISGDVLDENSKRFFTAFVDGKSITLNNWETSTEYDFNELSFSAKDKNENKANVDLSYYYGACAA